MVNCPLCDAPIDVDEEDLDEGDPLICEECGANLIVTGVDPLEIESDDDDEDDEEEDEDDLDDFDDEEEEEEDEWK
jgi:alpha-aminoadipate carrier protein LysW